MTAPNWKNPELRAQRISETRKGMKFSEKHRRNIGLSKKGQPSPNKGKTWIATAVFKERHAALWKGSSNPKWKGADVSYSALHHWIRRNFTKQDCCSFCNANHPRLQWANISRQYTRDRDDWEALCPSCHVRFDRDYNRNIAFA